MFLVITKSVRILYAGNISAYTSQSIFPPTPYPLVFPLIRYHPLLLRPCRYPCHQCKKCRRDTLKPLTMFHHHDLSSLKACLGVHLVQFRQMNWSSESTQIGSTGRVGQGLQWIWSIFRPDLELTRFIGGWPRVNVCPHILLFLLFTSFYINCMGRLFILQFYFIRFCFTLINHRFCLIYFIVWLSLHFWFLSFIHKSYCFSELWSQLAVETLKGAKWLRFGGSTRKPEPGGKVWFNGKSSLEKHRNMTLLRAY